jgi:hypothetical protein
MLTFLNKLKDFMIQTSNDVRIPSKDKKILLVLVGLLISPFDLIPDWIPLFGVMDDIVIMAIILDYFFSVLDPEIILSHFPWNMKAYSRIRTISKFMSFLVPKFLKNKLWSYVKSPY